MSDFPVECRGGGSVPLGYGSSAWLFSCLLSYEGKSVAHSSAVSLKETFSPRCSWVVYLILGV